MSANPTTFDDLASAGGNFLVRGGSPAGGQSRACRLLLGDPAARRRRVLVLPRGGRGTLDRRLPDDGLHDASEMVVVLHDLFEWRSSRARPTATGGPAPDAPDLQVREAGSTVRSVGETAAAAIEELTAGAADDGADLAPTELRVCLDGVGGLVRTVGPRDAFRFLHLLTRQVADNRGLGHFHAPYGVGDDTGVGRHRSLFDGVVEVRERPGGPEHRWDLSEGPTSEWLPLDPGGSFGDG